MPGFFLLVGGDSEIGAASAWHLRQRGHRVAATTRRRERVGAGRPFLDLAAPLADWEPPAGTRAAAIFAAVARLDACARDPVGSARVNVAQTLALVDRLRARDVPVLFLSTDKVFDGSIPLVRAEQPPRPASEYGRQKAATEAALHERASSGPPIAILRLSKVVSPGIALLAQWTAALAAGKAVNVFYDLYTAPVPVGLVAAAITDLMAEPARGIFQLSGPRDVSYGEIGGWLAGRIGAPRELVVPVSAYSAGLPPGSTPLHTTLDSSAICCRLGTVVADPWEVLEGVARAAVGPASLALG
jgi:dTDP-4-dehydrorhamnose reductase